MLKGQERNFLKVPGLDGLDVKRRLSDLLKENKINHLFYAIGLITTILKSDEPLNTLFNLQFRDPEKGSREKDRRYYYKLKDEMGYAQTGLAALRTVNESLQLIDVHYLKQTSSTKMTPLDR